MQQHVPSQSAQRDILKPFWSHLLGPSWVVGLLVLALVAGIRFFAAFSTFSLQGLYFLSVVAMVGVPFVFLTSDGMRQIGLRERGVTLSSMLYSAISGFACGLAFFALGMGIYGDSPNNWCISIRGYLHLEDMRGLLPPFGLFALYALPASFLNPIGEEILFRGLIQQSFSHRFKPAVGYLVNTVSFALMYVYIHGIYQDGAGFHVRWVSVVISVSLMACIGGVFSICRARSGSLWPAMAAHAAFNLTLLGCAIRQFTR